jgi:Pyruvate/2-oxoacid:ferredoxin oxidoreductase delta subunit
VRAVRIPVIGVGGISRGIDAVEMLMAGATAVQVCTAAILHGPGVFGKIAHELDTWLDEHGYATAAELRGLAMGGMSTAWSEGKPVVAEAPCNGCDLCAVSCPYDSITIVDKLAVIDYESCARCGLCVTRCRRGAIEWVAGVPAV